LGPAVRAEPGALGIGPTAPGAVDAWHSSARPPLSLVLGFDRSCPRYARRGGAVHAPREQPTPSASVILVATLPPHRVAPPPSLTAAAADDRPGQSQCAILSHSFTFTNSAWSKPFPSSREAHSLPRRRAFIWELIRSYSRTLAQSIPGLSGPLARPRRPTRRAAAARCRRRFPRPTGG